MLVRELIAELYKAYPESVVKIAIDSPDYDVEDGDVLIVKSIRPFAADGTMITVEFETE